MAVTYKDSGVDIEAGEKMVSMIKQEVAKTYNKQVLGGIGMFGGFYKIPKGYKKPVMVSSVDGVGTKLKIAIAMNRHDSVGQDLVNHCVNDIAVCGAIPLYFLDYLATGSLDPKTGYEIVKGMAKACAENKCSLIGGETAEMPGFYQDKDYDIAGTIVGIVEEKKIINGSKINKGDLMIALPSTGLHTNGYSLARKVLLEKHPLTKKFDELDKTLGEELLNIHRSYLKAIIKLGKEVKIKGMSHITGGGLEGNTKRILQDGLKLKVDWKAWEWPAIYQIIQKEGKVPMEDMKKTFNLGIGLVFVVSPKDLNKTLNLLTKINEKPMIIGSIV